MTKNVTVQFPVAAVLGIVFITLKLIHYIDWRWRWVLAPFWAPFAILLGFWVVFGIFFVLFQTVRLFR